MTALLAISGAIDRVTVFVGKAVSWLVLAAVLVSATNAVVRKAFDMSSNAWLELQWYLFGAVFLLAAAYTLQRNEHVRIDVISSRLSKRTRDIVDLVCHIVFLLPFAGLMVWLAIPYVRLSFRSGEISANAGGLILWPAKALILAGFILLLAQGFSEIIKRIAVLAGAIEEPTPQHHMPAVVEESLEMEDADSLANTPSAGLGRRDGTEERER